MTRCLLLGDSLMVGSAPYIRQLRPKWTYYEDAVIGRSIEKGVDAARDAIPRFGPHVILVSLGTNNGPSEFDAFVAAINSIRKFAGLDAYMSWATIHRLYNGQDPYAQWNTHLKKRNAFRKFEMTDWAKLAKDNPAVLAPDRVHATPDGYRQRARLYVEAASRMGVR